MGRWVAWRWIVERPSFLKILLNEARLMPATNNIECFAAVCRAAGAQRGLADRPAGCGAAGCLHDHLRWCEGVGAGGDEGVALGCCLCVQLACV